MSEGCCSTDRGEGYDLAILGGGSAAFAAALRGSELGARVLLVNAGAIGGTCVNVGCVPSKTLIRAAENAHWNGLSRFRGIKPEASRIDFGELVREKDELVASLRQAKYVDVAAGDPRIEVRAGRARLLEPRAIEIDGERFAADRILIATGTRPARPPIAGLDDPGVWDSTSALDASALPRELVVLGGRYIALELGQMFARLGSRVTIVQRSERIVPDEDPDVSEALADLLRAEGIEIRTGCALERVGSVGPRRFVWVRHDGRADRLEADAVLAALGRRPNSEGLAEVALDAAGHVRVNEKLETSVPGIYAAGDVIGDPQYVYAAAYEGGLAAENALLGSSIPRDYTAIPWVIFSDPQLAGVGLNESQARAARVEVDVSVLPLDRVPRALAARDTRGFVKLLRQSGTDRLVGARILAPEGSEQIMEASLMIRFGLSIQQVAHHFHPYLTQSEAIKLALLGLDKDVESLSCCAH
ncbi:MAG: mercury(II) reductase [Myxococcota bacterium]